jgi:transcriptional regulator with XRE-family HTH domain
VLSIRQARKRNGVTLVEIANKTGLLIPAISRAEREGTDPRVSTVLAIAKAMKLPVCELLDERVNHARDHRPKRQARR